MYKRQGQEPLPSPELLPQALYPPGLTDPSQLKLLTRRSLQLLLGKRTEGWGWSSEKAMPGWPVPKVGEGSGMWSWSSSGRRFTCDPGALTPHGEAKLRLGQLTGSPGAPGPVGSLAAGDWLSVPAGVFWAEKGTAGRPAWG